MSRGGQVTPTAALRTLIVDDEELARERLASMLNGITSIQLIGSADSGSTAVKAIADLRPDLVFLDVQMPGLDGFDVLRHTRSAHQPIVVFITAFDQHAIQAFDVHAADYLLKPVSRERLMESLRRITTRASTVRGAEATKRLESLLDHVSQPQSPRTALTIPVPSEAGTQLVPADDIMWIEADGDYARLHAGGISHMIRETLTDLEERLRHASFIRVHRSAIVNVTAIRSIQPISKGDYYLMLKDGTRVRSSRHYRRAVQSLMK